MTTPEVAIVISALNEERFLPWCLRSVKAQRGCSWECVVVDDGSTDQTAQIVQGFRERDERFRLIRHAQTRGLGAGRNSGIDAISAPLVTFLDADDFLFWGSLSARFNGLRSASEDVLGAYGDWVSVPERSRRIVPLRRRASKRNISVLTANRSVPFIASAPLLRTEIVRELGGFDEKLRTAEDAELWSWFLRLLGTFLYIPRIVVAYRRRGGSMAISDPLSHQEQIRRVLRNLDSTITRSHKALLSNPESFYRENAVAAPRALYAAAQALADGDETSTSAILSTIDPMVLRLLDPSVSAGEAVERVTNRRSGTTGGRDAARRLETCRPRLAKLIELHAASRPGSNDMIEAAAILREARTPFRL